MVSIDERALEWSYTVDKLDTIRSAIAGYAGGTAIARELVQNADDALRQGSYDARAAWIEFYFAPDRLVIKNGSRFTEQNFQAITRIGSGSRREDPDTIGTWGTGFLSVYQITDRPELYSSGIHLVFDPTLERLSGHRSEVQDHTEFHFRWRPEYTDIARHIEADPWPPERIQQLEDELGREIYRFLPFLRRITRIGVYRGLDQPKRLYEVTRERTSCEQLSSGAVRERWVITAYDYRHGEQRDEWVLYHGTLDQGFVRNGKEIKSRNISFGYGPQQPWLGEDLHGILYNFLPTGIHTGFAFHINGDFFPDANRTTILADDSEKAGWNRRVIAGLSQLFAANLERLRDESPSPEAFYRLLPIDFNTDYPFLQPIVDAFCRQAQRTRLIKTTDGAWSLPSDARWTDDAELRAIAQDYLPGIAPPSLPTRLRQFLTSLGARRLLLADYLAYLCETVPDGVALGKAPPVISSREKLDAVFSYIARALASSMPPAAKQELLRLLDGVPLCLDMDEELYAFGRHDIALADDETRALVPPGTYWTVDLSFQQRHLAVLERKLRWLDVGDIFDHLRQIAAECAGRPISQAHPTVNSWEKLRAILDYLIKRNVSVEQHDLRELALCPDETGTLHRIGTAPYLADAEIRNLLHGADVPFVAQQFEDSLPYAELLERAGVPRVTPSGLVGLLEEYCPGRQPLQEAHPVLRSVDRLRGLYRFFQKHASELEEDDRQRLRRLPFVLTQGGDLAAIDDPDVPLLLPPLSADGEEARFTDVLELDNLISERVLDDELRVFFRQTLRVSPLSAVRYIEEYVTRHYERPGMDHAARLQLLRLVRDCYPRLKEQRREDILSKLREVRLVRCNDGQYRVASDVYFPSEFLDNIFPEGYPFPHTDYAVPKETTDYGRRGRGTRPAYEDSAWHELFAALGMQTHPRAQDIVASVRRTIASPPTIAAMDHIRPIYELLDDRWTEEYAAAQAELAPLRDLRWLPAEGDSTRWYQPRELYPIGLKALIESQANLIPFRQASRQFSDFLELNVEARLIDVVHHLLWLSGAGQPVSPQVYQFLSRHRDAPEIQALVGKPVIYDRRHERFWPPHHVFLGNFYEEFGPYRCYLGDDIGDWLVLFRRLGVRDRIDPVRDYVALLEDIVHAHSEEPFDQEDQRLINRSYVQLAAVLEGEDVELRAPEWVQRLAALPVVLDQDLRLAEPQRVFFNDRPDLLDKFPPGGVRIARYADERARPFLAKLGVRPLSEVVKRRRARVDGDALDQGNTTRLRLFVPQFRRIIEAYRKRFPAGWVDLTTLTAAEVHVADRIEIRYVIDVVEPPILGSIEPQDAFFDTASRRLYLSARTGELGGNALLAREVSLLLNPTLEPQFLAPMVAALLDVRQLSNADALLDSFGVGRTDVTREELLVSEEAKRAALAQVGGPIDATVGNEGLLSSGDGRVPESVGERTRLDQTATPPPAPPDIPVTRVTTPAAARKEIESAEVGEDEEPVPSFDGETRPRVPLIPTDYRALRERYGIPGDGASSLEELGNALRQEDLAEDVPVEPDRRVDEVRFVLSFMNRYEGFLPLTRAAATLLAGHRRVIECTTDYGDSFPLYIDQQERVIYNQRDLPRFFAAHDIPAGGIVYLMRVHGRTFRLYYKEQPHVVRNVRLAELGEDGMVRYTILPEVEVRCETDEFVLRADKRLEDSPALFKEAVGKKSVFETLCDIFEQTGAGRLHQEELFNTLSMIRMVSYYAVQTELRERPCFVDEGGGYWSFDPSRGLKRPQRPAHRASSPQAKPIQLPSQPESPESPSNVAQVLERDLAAIGDRLRSLATEPEQLTQVLRRLRAQFVAFVSAVEELYRRIQEASEEGTAPAGPDAPGARLLDTIGYLLARLRENPNDGESGSQFQAVLQGMLERATAGDHSHDAELLAVFQMADASTWGLRILPALKATADRCAAQRQYGVARTFVQWIEQYSGRSQKAELDRLDAQQQAYEYLSVCDGSSPIEDELGFLREALQLDPGLTEARQRYDANVQALLDPLLDTATRHLEENRVGDSVRAFDEAMRLVDAHRSYMADARAVQEGLDRVCLNILDGALDQARRAADRSDYKAALAAYLPAAHLYLTLSSSNLRKERSSDYLEALEEIGNAYFQTQQFVEAVIAYTRAIEFWQQEATGGYGHGQLVTVRSCLAEAYEQLGLWDWSQNVRRKLVETCQPARRQQEQAKLEAANMKNRDQRIAVAAAHRRFLQELQRCRRASELIAAVTSRHLDSLVSREQERLARSG